MTAPAAQRLANQEKVLIDEEVDRLVEHGLLQLINI